MPGLTDEPLEPRISIATLHFAVCSLSTRIPYIIISRVGKKKTRANFSVAAGSATFLNIRDECIRGIVVDNAPYGRNINSKAKSIYRYNNTLILRTELF